MKTYLAANTAVPNVMQTSSPGDIEALLPHTPGSRLTPRLKFGESLCTQDLAQGQFARRMVRDSTAEATSDAASIVGRHPAQLVQYGVFDWRMVHLRYSRLLCHQSVAFRARGVTF